MLNLSKYLLHHAPLSPPSRRGEAFPAIITLRPAPLPEELGVFPLTWKQGFQEFRALLEFTSSLCAMPPSPRGRYWLPQAPWKSTGFLRSSLCAQPPLSEAGPYIFSSLCALLLFPRSLAFSSFITLRLPSPSGEEGPFLLLSLCAMPPSPGRFWHFSYFITLRLPLPFSKGGRRFNFQIVTKPFKCSLQIIQPWGK